MAQRMRTVLGRIFQGRARKGAEAAGCADLPNAAARQSGASGYGVSADMAYAAIRSSNSDISAIARNTGLKPSNIQKVKDHLFFNQHLLDRYERLGVPSEFRRFDSNLDIADSWRRLQSGSYGPRDIQLLRHEIAEAWYMRRHGPSYNRAHSSAKRIFPSPLE